MCKETNEKKTNVRKGVEWYKKEIVEMAEKIEDISVLKKIYTVIKTHISILNEK